MLRDTTNWILITGSYPPDQGGVADYTWVLAREFAQRGDRVWVFTGPGEAGPSAPGVTVHRLKEHFTPFALRELERRIAEVPSPRRILVQYVPQPFGPRAGSRFRGLPMWVPMWLSRRRGDPVWYVMHEAVTLAAPGAAWRTKVLDLASRRMLRWAGQSAERMFYVMPAWRQVIEKHVGPRPKLEYLPVPSNVDTDIDPNEARFLRSRLFPTPERPLIGHFGTFSDETTVLLQPVLEQALHERADMQVALIGQGSCEFAARLRPFGHRIVATGALDSRGVARHLAACDLLVQPFPDGASTRRGSIMAGLALGLPVLSNEGERSEPLWRETGALALEPSVDRLPRRMLDLLSDPDQLESIGAAGRILYEERFSLNRTVDRLRERARS